MKYSLYIIFFLIVFYSPLYAQYQGELSGGSREDVATCIWVYADDIISYPFIGGFYQSEDGSFSSNYGKEDCFVSGIYPNSMLSWMTVFGGSQHDYLYDIIRVNGAIYVAGASDSNDYDITGNHGGEDYLVAKLDSTGQLLWVKSFGGSGTDVATSIIFYDNYIWVLGFSNSSDGDVTVNYGNFDMWLIKLDTDGNLVWQKNYGGSDDDRSSDMDFVYDNNLVASGLMLAGYSKSFDGDLNLNHGDYDFWLVHIDNTGSIVTQQSFGGSGSDLRPKISTSSGVSIDVVGSTNSTDGDITDPLGGYDVWWLSGSFYNGLPDFFSFRNIGGSDDDFGTGVLNFPIATCGCATVFIIFNSKSSDGDTYINHGGFDAWFMYQGIYGGTAFFNFGGQNDDEFLDIHPVFDMNGLVYDFNKYAYFAGRSNSVDIPGTMPHGKMDAWWVNGDYFLQKIPEYAINVNMYPNPVKDKLHIEVEHQKIKAILLYDLTGKLLIHEDLDIFQHSYILNLQSLKPGDYFLKILTNEGMAIKKLIKAGN